MITRLSALSGIFLCLAFAATADEDAVLLFSYFTGNGEDGLHLAWSEDGLTWQALKGGKSFMSPQVGEEKLVRDPCVVQGPDGLFHMVWTTSWRGKGIGYAHSKDLIDWSEQRFLPVMANEPEVLNCWAPELFYDAAAERYLIFWASTVPGRFPDTPGNEGDLNHRMYYTETKDFQDFAPAKLLYEHGFNVIDSTIEKTGERYVMFLKDETREPAEKNIRVAFADQPEGPWSAPSPPITGDYWAEGPTAIQIDGVWHVYFDKYRKDRFGAVVSEDLKTWRDISEQVHFPEGARHGTVFRVKRSVFEKLRARRDQYFSRRSLFGVRPR